MSLSHRNPPLSSEFVAKIQRIKAEGLSIAELCERFNLGREQVKKALGYRRKKHDTKL